LSFLNRKTKQAPDTLEITKGRISLPNASVKRITGNKQRERNLLQSLQNTTDVYKAIELIVKQHPDAKMAVTSILRLSNNGNTTEFYDKNGKRNNEVESEWHSFCQRVHAISNDGLDGLVNQLHKSALLFGGMGGEIVVKSDLSDIEDVYPILPQSIEWNLEKRDGIDKWVAYQTQGSAKVDLSKGNFVWIAFDPDIDQPQGTLMLESALQAIVYQLQFLADTSAVLRRVGYPRMDWEIDREAVLKSLPANVRNDPQKLKDAMRERFEWIKSLMRELEPTDDFVHFDDMKQSGKGASGDGSRTIDIRAYNEIVDPQVINGLGCMSLLLNRTTGSTETWGTVQLQIMVKTIENLQRGSKRFIENIQRIWLQVKGYDLTPKFSHNPVDYQNELAKLDVHIKKLEVNRRAEEYEWIDKQSAARNAMNVAELPTDSENTHFAYINKIVGAESEQETTSNQAEEEENV